MIDRNTLLKKLLNDSVPNHTFHFFLNSESPNFKRQKEFPKQRKDFPKGYKVSLTMLTLLLSITFLPLSGYQAISNNVTKECLPR